MSGIWQEHRRFIVSLVVAGLLTLIPYLVISSHYQSQIARSESRITRARRSQRRARGSANLKSQRQEREHEEDLFKGMQVILERIPDPEAGLQLPAGVTNADLYYSHQIEKVRRDVVELCALRNIEVDQNLGLPDRFPSSKRDKNWYLMGLDVVRQILLLALDADQSLEGGIVRVDSLHIAPRSSRKRRKQAEFVEMLQVTASVVGHPRAIDHMLRTLPVERGPLESPAEGPGRFLALQEASINSLDQPPGSNKRKKRSFMDAADRNRVRLDLKLAAVLFNREKSR